VVEMENDRELALKRVIKNQLNINSELDRIERTVLEVKNKEGSFDLDTINRFNLELETIHLQFKGILKK
jgi:hypothetical protein